MQTGLIYMATINGRKYIGRSVNFQSRKSGHLRARTDCAFHRAIQKHGAHAVTWRILAEEIPVHHLSTYEVFWIRFYDTYHNGLNATPGGEASASMCPEVRKKMSNTVNAQVERGDHPMQRPEVRKKISETMKKKSDCGENPSQSPEVRNKISNKMKELANRGELGMQNPEIATKAGKTRSRTNCRKRFQNQVEAGQEFMLDMKI